MGYGRVTSSAAHFQRNMAFPGGILSALFSHSLELLLHQFVGWGMAGALKWATSVSAL
jgi:hypothetical protein